MDDNSEQASTAEGSASKRWAGAFDIRNFVGALIGIYGVVLVVMGLVNVTSADLLRTGGVNANLFAGVVMVIFAAIFIIWARLRPVEIAARTEEPALAAFNNAEPDDHDQPTR